jgi:hypothetical protein
MLAMYLGPWLMWCLPRPSLPPDEGGAGGGAVPAALAPGIRSSQGRSKTFYPE